MNIKPRGSGKVLLTRIAAGFGSLPFEKLGDIPCFQVIGVELREMPRDRAGESLAFERPPDDTGNVYEPIRGQHKMHRVSMRPSLELGLVPPLAAAPPYSRALLGTAHRPASRQRWKTDNVTTRSDVG